MNGFLFFRCPPLLGGGAQGLAGSAHHVAGLGAVMLGLEAQEEAELVLLLGQACRKRTNKIEFEKPCTRADFLKA